MSERRKIRCAIYTRKSSEEGLEQEFNSLDAQFEACAAYIASQKHEGWVLLKDRYDDGGVSGGTLERPAVRRLLADVDAGRVNRVVVYKVDRLTRSLADFAKLVDRFDGVGASFVSVTQSFNTATSMGRLTLNVLLSFAQFEREVTAERIRDKIAASKRKGMWMGGVAPLGYDASDRTLVVNKLEAEIVRKIFALYLEHGNIRTVKAELDRLNLRTKHRPGLKGTAKGGARFGRGRIQHLLTNPVYIGRIRHKDQTYEGAHDAIVDIAVWDAVNTKLIQQAAKVRGRTASCQPAPLAGKIIDETGDRLTPSHANKKGRRYRYYVSHRLIDLRGDSDHSGWRIAAEQLERAFADEIARRMDDAGFAIQILEDPTVVEIDRIRRAATNVVESLRTERRSELLASLIAGGSISPDAIAVELEPDALAQLFDVSADRIDRSRLSIMAPCQMRRRGVETRIVIEDAPAEVDKNLVSKIGVGVGWFDEIKAGGSIKAIAERSGVTTDRVAQILRLAWLAPGIVDAAIEGRQPERLTVDAVLKSPHIALWSEQRAWANSL